MGMQLTSLSIGTVLRADPSTALEAGTKSAHCLCDRMQTSDSLTLYAV
jgi:hypothetical protein